jgi:hypothetical protein
MQIANSAHITKAGNDAKPFRSGFLQPFGQEKTSIESHT